MRIKLVLMAHTVYNIGAELLLHDRSITICKIPYCNNASYLYDNFYVKKHTGIASGILPKFVHVLLWASVLRIAMYVATTMLVDIIMHKIIVYKMVMHK